MPEHSELKDQARSKTRDLLAKSQSFLAMDRSEQMALYKDLVDAHYSNLAEAQGLATEMAVAGDLINKERHQNDRIGRAGQTTADILSDTVRKVNFPGFVSDLLNGIFDANLNANIKQMKAFQDLLKSASQSLSTFVNSINDDEAMYRVVELDSKYKVMMERVRARGSARPGTGATPAQSNPEAAQQPVLVDQSGKKVNMNDSSIQAKILDAKLAMAKERRTMLRETILMGVSRLVVEKGTIRAEVKFKIDATENTTNTDSADASQTNSFSSGWSAGIFGGPSLSFDHSDTKITVASSDSQLDTTSSTDMTGFVEIQFKSDYFKLDNFKETFDLGTGQVATGQLPSGAAPAQPIPAAPQPTA